MEKNNTNAISLRRFAKVFKQGIWIILAAIILFGAAAGIYVTQFVTPLYTSTALMVVQNKKIQTDDKSAGDITASKELVESCKVLLESRLVLEKVITELDLNISVSELSNMITISSVNSTEYMDISVQTEDPALSAKIANALIDEATIVYKDIIESGSLSIIDRGLKPSSPSYPNEIFMISIGALIGFFVSYTVLFLIDFFNTKVKTDDNLSDRYDYPVFAEIPDMNKLNSGNGYAYYYAYGKKREKPEHKTKRSKTIGKSNNSPSVPINEKTQPAVTEAYNTARTNLQFAVGTYERKILVFTSANPNDAKTTTVANTAVSFANAGYRVLIVDADLRKSAVGRFFGVKKENGLSYYLCNMCTLDEALSYEVLPNLDVMSVGKIPPNPSELLMSSRMVAFLEDASQKYDYIFIDTPPVNILSDSQLFNSIASGIIFVVKEEFTTYNEIDEAIERIKVANGKLLGFVKSFCSIKSRGMYRNKRYSYKYGYYYGKDEKSKVSDDKSIEKLGASK